jgi:hypothetical protein
MVNEFDPSKVATGATDPSSTRPTDVLDTPDTDVALHYGATACQDAATTELWRYAVKQLRKHWATR